MVSASPVATWLAAKPRVMRANAAASATPAPIPATAPTSELPERMAAAKPQEAPMIIMPSTPRLSTPERSTTSSPTAASSSGVEAVITVSRIASSSMAGDPAARAEETDAIGRQHVAGEDIEEQHPFQHIGEIERHAQADLRRLAAEIGERQDQPGKDNADG